MSDELLLIINPAHVVVDPGGIAEVALQIQNRSGVVDEFVVEVLGEAAAWTAVDRPRVPIFPDGEGSVQVSIRPPRSSRPEAGTIPIGFKVRSTVDPSRSTVEECQVEVKPYVEIEGEITPKTVKGRFSASHRLRVINRGNAPVNVSVRADVQQGDCQVSVPEAPLQVGAGERTTTTVRVRPSSAHWRGAEEMHSYRLTLEPKGGTPVALDATMRQRPIAQIPTALLVAAALFLGGAYIAYGKAPNPLQTAFRNWTGTVESSPSAAPSALPAASAASSASPTPTTQTTPTATPSPSAVPSTPVITTFHPLPVCSFAVAPLTSITLKDTVNGSTHTLTWQGNSGCAPFTGTITARYGTFIAGIFTTATYQISGQSGTYQDTHVAASYSYTITLKDGSGHTATATAT